jgi:NTP pyrophosphatase (non-canonical NTP hydrolase)
MNVTENAKNKPSVTSDSALPATRDSHVTLQALRTVVATFVHERNWEQFHNPKNLAMSLAIEAAELMEHFQWRSLEESAQIVHRSGEREKIAEEMADCLAYILALANAMQLDLAQTLIDKMHKNAQKYPIDQAFDRWEKPQP